jgi:hypothetical protein
MRWLPGLSHVPISDDPALVGRLIRQFVDDAERARSHGGDLTAASFQIAHLIRQRGSCTALPRKPVLGKGPQPVVGSRFPAPSETSHRRRGLSQAGTNNVGK